MTPKIYKVKEFNNIMRAKSEWIMIMTKGNGSMIDEPRKTGYVVYYSPSARWFSNYDKALNFFQTLK